MNKWKLLWNRATFKGPLIYYAGCSGEYWLYVNSKPNRERLDEELERTGGPLCGS